MNAAPDRLLHLVAYAARGGCERCCEVFIRHCPGFTHHVVVLGEPGPMSEVWVALGATVEHLDLLGTGWVAFHARLRARLQAQRFDRVIVWAGVRVPLVLSALARPGCRVVVHAGNPFEGGWRVRSLLWLGARVARRPERVRVLGCSEHVVRSYRPAPYYRELPLAACLNPVPAPSANPHGPRLLTPDGRVRLGMVARLDPIKDHATLLRAFALVREHWPRAELHLAGGGPQQRALEELAALLGLGAAVCFHGPVADVPAFLQTLDLFCFITTAREGMGIALAEALAAGLPCVVNDLPVMREVAGEAACFAPAGADALGRAIAGLLEDEPARRRLSAAAWQRARDAFAPGAVVQRYLTALEVVP